MGEEHDVANAGAVRRRNPLLPNIPAVTEVSYPEMAIPFWHALYARAARPRPIVERLNEALRRALADPQVAKAYKDSGAKHFRAISGASRPLPHSCGVNSIAGHETCAKTTFRRNNSRSGRARTLYADQERAGRSRRSISDHKLFTDVRG